MTDQTRDALIKDATYKKDLKISYYNSLNAAIALAQNKHFENDEAMVSFIDKHKMRFLEQWGEYYHSTVLVSRTPYNPLDSIKKVKDAKTLDALHAVWLALSEDERRNPEIIKVKDAAKKKLTKEAPKVGEPSQLKE